MVFIENHLPDNLMHVRACVCVWGSVVRGQPCGQMALASPTRLLALSKTLKYSRMKTSPRIHCSELSSPWKPLVQKFWSWERQD